MQTLSLGGAERVQVGERGLVSLACHLQQPDACPAGYMS